ncbi:adenylate/guanylate cyclase domain-containing protein [Treponema sp. OttesenSCG-928-L16]|nr:adenylate/guanylate cyclase domain-containing protein [Treponema sp. OttesenSCG-928-L16]
MSSQSLSATRNVLFSIICILSSFILILLLSKAGLFVYLDRSIGDRLFAAKLARSPEELHPLIIPVDLNDRSERLLVSRIDDRRAFADLLTILAMTNSQVVMDLLFKTPKPDDALFVQAAEMVHPLVLSLVPIPAGQDSFSYRELGGEEKELLRHHLWHPREYSKGSIPRAANVIMPFQEIARAASHFGHIGIEPDDDGIYRKTPLFYRWEDGLIPSLALAAYVSRSGLNYEDIEIYHGREVIISLSEQDKIKIPIDNTGSIIIPYPSSWQYHTKRISLDTAVNALHDQNEMIRLFDEFFDRVIFVADISADKKDFGPSPFEKIYPLSGIHTSVLSGILNEKFYREFRGEEKLLIALVILFIMFCLLYMNGKDFVYHSGFFLLFAAYTCFMVLAWYNGRIIPCYSRIGIWIVLVWAAGFFYRLEKRYREQELLRNALSRYFPRSLADRIIAEGKTDLVPVYKELTILFSDISGFTRWSSDKDASEVHRFLTDYVEAMAKMLHDHGGTVDKFMGDGILAFFGDPVEQPDHAERCLKAAIAMQKRVQELAEKWKSLVNIDLKVRIGINSGRVIVGNLGTRTRIEYTVIGAAVNLAQRMESNAPVGGILVAKNSWEKTKHIFSFGDKRTISVKGYDAPIEAYEVVM